ncbi:MAG TPA: carboxypeptidase-like regulatory domain-containing protein [Candidatus Limnocylindrales bacterium]|nr:carboxypeptidase-like regulatory domain-containing protein [Candidatus Limnocylindrales bacterium]
MSRIKTLLQWVIVLAAICIAGGSLQAQEVRATIGGRVTDPTGALVPNALVVVKNDDTLVKNETHTNGQGIWSIQFLNPGEYEFSVAAAGFKTAERKGVTLQAADNKQFDTSLEVGASTQTVDVVAEAPLIDTTSATSGTVITQEQINEMPTSSHVITLLATMSPGVLAQDQNNNVAHLWSYNAASQFTADGGRNIAYSNSFQLDGMPDVKSGGNVAFIPPMDSVQEFRVQTNAYDASIGRQAGATINMQTKSGTKAYHGTLYEFNQNSFLNANLLQSNLIGGKVAPVHFNNWGGTFGGPVWIPKVYKGTAKTFFFVSFDDSRNSNFLGDGTRSVPSALERTGDFSQSFTTQNLGGVLQRFPIQIYDPYSTDPKTGNRTPYQNNMIPANQLSPIAQAILKYVPLPNTPNDPTGNDSNNFVPPAVRTDKFPALSIRGDQNWTQSQRSFVTVRWHHLTELTGDDFGPSDIASGAYQVRISKQAGLDHVITLGPSKVLDLHFNVNRYEEPSYDAGAGFDITKLGFSPSVEGLLTRSSFPYITGVAGNFGTGNAGSFTGSTYYSAGATMTQIHGKHTFRYGAEYWVLQQATNGIGHQPEFDFNGNYTRQNYLNSGGTGVGSTLASFLLGLPSGGAVDNNAQAFWSQRYTGAFFQDDIRLSRKLTINLGMRWDFENEPVERFDRTANRWDPTAVNPISAQAQANYAAMLASPANASNPAIQLLAQLMPASQFQVLGTQLYAGVNGVPRTVVNNDYHEWQPRAGFAYQIDANTVLRGGFGRFTQADFITGSQSGFSRTTSLIASTDNGITPFDTMANPFRSGILQPVGNSLGPLSNPTAGPSWYDPNLGRLYSWEYSLHLQHQWKGWLFEAGYSHNKTYGIWNFGTWFENEQPLSLWKQYQTPTFDATGKPVATLTWNQPIPNPFKGIPALAGTSLGSNSTLNFNQFLSPNAMFSSSGIAESKPSGTNQYDAMLSNIERRFSKGFSILGSFTWAKLFEDTSFLGPQIAGYHVEHKLGGEDRPFHLAVSPIWNIPVGRKLKFGSTMPKWADAVVGGWELSGNYNIQSGVPVVFGTASFFCGRDFKLSGSQQSLSKWFDTSCFYPFPNANTTTAQLASYPAWTGVQNLPGYNYVPQAGDTIKNGVYQDFANYIQTNPTRWGDVRASRVNNVDLGLRKNFQIVERVKLQLRFDAFNAFNHPRFGGPDTNPGDSTFGRVTPSQQNQARSVELGGRLSW